MKIILSDFIYTTLLKFLSGYNNTFVFSPIIGNNVSSYPFTLYAISKNANIIYLYFSSSCTINLPSGSGSASIVFGSGSCVYNYYPANICFIGTGTNYGNCLYNLPFTILYSVPASTVTFIVRITLPQDIT